MKYEDIPKDAIVDGWVVGNDYVVEGTYKKTCQQCIHFYEREPKPWRTMADIGYCDHSREGKIEINKYCPVNKWCDNKFELPADYGHDMAKFNAYCETYNNAVKQCLEVHHDL